MIIVTQDSKAINDYAKGYKCYIRKALSRSKYIIDRVWDQANHRIFIVKAKNHGIIEKMCFTVLAFDKDKNVKSLYHIEEFDAKGKQVTLIEVIIRLFDDPNSIHRAHDLKLNKRDCSLFHRGNKFNAEIDSEEEEKIAYGATQFFNISLCRSKLIEVKDRFVCIEEERDEREAKKQAQCDEECDEECEAKKQAECDEECDEAISEAIFDSSINTDCASDRVVKASWIREVVNKAYECSLSMCFDFDNCGYQVFESTLTQLSKNWSRAVKANGQFTGYEVDELAGLIEEFLTRVFYAKQVHIEGHSYTVITHDPLEAMSDREASQIRSKQVETSCEAVEAVEAGKAEKPPVKIKCSDNWVTVKLANDYKAIDDSETDSIKDGFEAIEDQINWLTEKLTLHDCEGDNWNLIKKMIPEIESWIDKITGKESRGAYIDRYNRLECLKNRFSTVKLMFHRIADQKALDVEKKNLQIRNRHLTGLIIDIKTGKEKSDTIQRHIDQLGDRADRELKFATSDEERDEIKADLNRQIEHVAGKEFGKQIDRDLEKILSKLCEEKRQINLRLTEFDIHIDLSEADFEIVNKWIYGNLDGLISNRFFERYFCDEDRIEFTDTGNEYRGLESYIARNYYLGSGIIDPDCLNDLLDIYNDPESHEEWMCQFLFTVCSATDQTKLRHFFEMNEDREGNPHTLEIWAYRYFWDQVTGYDEEYLRKALQAILEQIQMEERGEIEAV